MEEMKAQTETRKQRSQALEKTARLKKKSQISEKKEQKAEVKRKIEDSLPLGSPRLGRVGVDPDSNQTFRCTSCKNEYRLYRTKFYGRYSYDDRWYCSSCQWVCLDYEKYKREQMVKERRLMVKGAFQEQAKMANGFSKVRKLGAAKKIEHSLDDFDDGGVQ